MFPTLPTGEWPAGCPVPVPGTCGPRSDEPPQLRGHTQSAHHNLVASWSLVPTLPICSLTGSQDGTTSWLSADLAWPSLRSPWQLSCIHICFSSRGQSPGQRCLSPGHRRSQERARRTPGVLLRCPIAHIPWADSSHVPEPKVKGRARQS